MKDFVYLMLLKPLRKTSPTNKTKKQTVKNIWKNPSYDRQDSQFYSVWEAAYLQLFATTSSTRGSSSFLFSSSTASTLLKGNCLSLTVERNSILNSWGKKRQKWNKKVVTNNSKEKNKCKKSEIKIYIEIWKWAKIKKKWYWWIEKEIEEKKWKNLLKLSVVEKATASN